MLMVIYTIVILIIWFSLTDCAAIATATPSTPLHCSQRRLANTVLGEGKSTSFQRLNNGQLVQWEVLSSSDFFRKMRPITNYDDIVVSQFSKTYAVIRSQLKVFSSTVAPQNSMPYATAGLYVLKYLNPNCTTAANLIVISKSPKSNRTLISLFT